MIEHDCVTNFLVIEETEDYIAVVKPAPLIVHPTDKKGQPTLLCGLQQLLAYEIVNGIKLSIINRLDRETSGVVLVAKNKSTARSFNRSMERRTVRKTYLAIVLGNPEWDKIEVTAPIGNLRDVAKSKIWLKQSVSDIGKPSSTVFSKKKDYDGFCLVEVKPRTGRMHQIRVHASYLGFPIVGDKIYGPDEDFYLQHIDHGWSKQMDESLLLKRQALHASELEIEHEDSIIRLAAPLADDLVSFLHRHCE